MELLDANYTFLNQRLAEHYGIPNVYGPQFRKVALTDPNRGGLLGTGKHLTVTSYPNRTSVVQRGKWILETCWARLRRRLRLMCRTWSRTRRMARMLTMREAMEQHRVESGVRVLPCANGPARVCAGEL